ncbi:MAG: winged helix-turn-helix transcriptional regulator [Chloroflexi bacterium]|nr:MAG: winged helix-turn-helix transcriptional regulator [Chloroflexota bacterium]
MSKQSAVSACRTLKRVLQDYTRALVFNELLMGGEITASIIAKRLETSFTKVSYHIRILQGADIIEPVRVVVAGYRKEKFYRIKPGILSALFGTADALGAAYGELNAAERQIIHCTYLAVVSNVLRRAADRYERMDPERFDELFREHELMMLAFGSVPREMFKQVLRVARAALPETWNDLDAETPWKHPDYVVFASLPDLLTTLG